MLGSEGSSQTDDSAWGRHRFQTSPRFQGAACLNMEQNCNNIWNHKVCRHVDGRDLWKCVEVKGHWAWNITRSHRSEHNWKHPRNESSSFNGQKPSWFLTLVRTWWSGRSGRQQTTCVWWCASVCALLLLNTSWPLQVTGACVWAAVWPFLTFDLWLITALEPCGDSLLSECETVYMFVSPSGDI